MSPKCVLHFEFGAESAEAFGAGGRHPAESLAEKGVLFFAFQFLTEGFLIELLQFFGELHALCLSLGECRTLTARNTDAMKGGDGFPADVALRIKRPVGGNENHGAVRRDVDCELEQQGLIVLHAVEMPAQAKGVECCTEGVCPASQVHGKGRAQIALCAHGAADHAFIVGVWQDIEGGFDACPLALQLWVSLDGEFGLGELGLRINEVFVAAALDVSLVIGHRRTDGFSGWCRQHVDDEALLSAQAFALFQGSKKVIQHRVDIERPQRQRDENPFVENTQPRRGRILQIWNRIVVAAQSVLGPFRSMIGAGLEFFQIALQGFCHG